MRSYIQISGLIFGVVALVHGLRLIMPWPVVIAGWSAPQWVSAVGVFVAGALCVWALRLLAWKSGSES